MGTPTRMKENNKNACSSPSETTWEGARAASLVNCFLNEHARGEMNEQWEYAPGTLCSQTCPSGYRLPDSQTDVKVECYCKKGEDWDYNQCCFTPDRKEPFQTTCIPKACDADIELLKLRFSRGIDGLKFCPDEPGTLDFDLSNCRNDTVPSTDDFDALICPSDAYWPVSGDERLNGKVMPGSTCFLSCSSELELARDQRALDGITCVFNEKLQKYEWDVLIYSLDADNEPICEYIPICMLPGYFAVDDYKLYDSAHEAYPDY